MIEENMTDKIVTIGCSYTPPKGGVAQVIETYSHIYEKFRFIETTQEGFIKYFIVIIAYFRLFFLCLNKNIKIVHIHGASYNSFWRKRIFIYLAKWMNKKVVYHIHGGGFRDFSSRHTDVVKQTLDKCDCIVALSESWKSFYIDKMMCRNVRVIKNIIPEPTIAKKEKENQLIHGLYLGLITQQKGIFDLLEAIAQQRDSLTNRFLLHVAGNGGIMELEALIKTLNLDELVRYEGWVSGEKKTNLLNQADFYILPSYIEGLPISILEAMSYHLPIISTAVGGIPEIVNEQNGILVQPSDLNEIGDAILELVNNPAMRLSMGENSWNKVQSHLSKNVEKELIDMYTSLL